MVNNPGDGKYSFAAGIRFTTEVVSVLFCRRITTDLTCLTIDRNNSQRNSKLWADPLGEFSHSIGMVLELFASGQINTGSCYTIFVTSVTSQLCHGQLEKTHLPGRYPRKKHPAENSSIVFHCLMYV